MENNLLAAGLAIAFSIFQTIFYLLRKKNIEDYRKLNEEARKENRELIEKLSDSFVARDKTINEISQTVEKTHSLHDVKDSDGNYIWYVPRSWREIQENIKEICREILSVEKQQIELIKYYIKNDKNG